MTSLTLTAAQLEHVTKYAESYDICESCEGQGEYDFSGEGEEICDDCNGDGKIRSKVRVTVPFEKQPKKTSHFTGFFDLPLGGKCAMFLGPTESNTFALPIPIGATVKVRKVCGHCNGTRRGNMKGQGCADCADGTVPTPYTLTFDKEPWCGHWCNMPQQYYREWKTQGSPDVGLDGDLKRNVASYEATVGVKKEVEG